MLDKAEVRRRLLCFFAASHVNAWLAKFPDTHRWRDEDYSKEFIDYINSLPEFK